MRIDIPESKWYQYLFADTHFAWLWLIVRVYIGYEWLVAGWDKFQNPAWIGPNAGGAVKGFLMGALEKTGGPHPDVTQWYAYFVKNFALEHVKLFSYLVTYGEIIIGAALILGLFTGVAALFGLFLNFNFLLSGTVSVNPQLVFYQVFIFLAWRSAGWWGLDRFVLPKVGAPWRWGKVKFKQHEPIV